MTIWQILALAFAGPIGLFCFLKMLWSITDKNAQLYLWEIALMIVCGILITLSFVGIT